MARPDGDQLSERELQAKRAELEQKRALVEQLKQKKAETEQHLANLQQGIQSQRAEINAAILYMDEVARPNLERYNALVASGSQDASPELTRLRSQIGLYTHTREAMVRFERSIGNSTSLIEQTVAMRLAEAEIVLASSRMVLVDFAESRRSIQGLVPGGRMTLEERKRLAPVVDRLAKMPLLQQRLHAALSLFQELENLVNSEDFQVQELKRLQGRDALKVAQGLKLTQISGKVNQLRGIRPSFQMEPLIMNLFPEWVEVQIPKPAPGGGERAPTKPFTGRLKELFGFK